MLLVDVVGFLSESILCGVGIIYLLVLISGLLVVFGLGGRCGGFVISGFLILGAISRLGRFGMFCCLWFTVGVLACILWDFLMLGRCGVACTVLWFWMLDALVYLV